MKNKVWVCALLLVLCHVGCHTSRAPLGRAGKDRGCVMAMTPCLWGQTVLSWHSCPVSYKLYDLEPSSHHLRIITSTPWSQCEDWMRVCAWNYLKTWKDKRVRDESLEEAGPSARTKSWDHLHRQTKCVSYCQQWLVLKIKQQKTWTVGPSPHVLGQGLGE